MGKIVVLAEKPSVGRDIARVLRCHKNGNGYIEGDTYIVTWALGHLVTLADPEAYDHSYQSWKLEDLPILPASLKLDVIKQSGKQFRIVREQLHRKDVTHIIIATDAGREGELVARWIIEKAGVKKPLKRLWISSVTDKAILEGFRKIRDGREHEGLYASAQSRAEADWYVGINATRALTCKYNAQLSCGRVQTPTLAIIAHRENEIREFIPEPYYGITAVTKEIRFTWLDKRTKSTRIFDQTKMEQIYGSLHKKALEVVEVHKSMKKSYSPQLYDLTELQRDAHQIYGYSAKETLSIMQKLYEQHKLVTYPRTDSRYISRDIEETIMDRVNACSIQRYAHLTAKLRKGPIKVSKHVVDDHRVTDHHAIIPTEQSALVHTLGRKELHIYDLIVKRFLAVLYPPFQYEQTEIEAYMGDQLFSAKGKRVLDLGWKGVYDQSLEEESIEGELADQSLPLIQKGEKLQVQELQKTKGETKPPRPFNEGTLLTAMENPSRFVEQRSKDIIQTLQKTGGLGTVATRADIIEKLFNTFLIEKRGKDIHLTSKGKQLLELVPEELKSPQLTAEWEQKLELIAKGILQKASFINEIKSYTRAAVSQIKTSTEQFKHDNITGSKCPECGRFMLEVKGKKGTMLVCQDRECGHRKNVSKLTNARCPNCRKKLELRGQGEGQLFVCVCGHREKLSTFNERKKKESNSKISKKEVSKFLHKQGKEEPINTALADALAKLKLDQPDDK